MHPSADSTPRYTRRALFRTATALAAAGAAAGALAGCDAVAAVTGDTEPRWRPADDLAPLLLGTIALADRYDEAISAVASLAERLKPIRDEHRAHVIQLAREIGSFSIGVALRNNTLLARRP